MSVVRYAIGELCLPYLAKWVLDKFEVDVKAGRNAGTNAKPMPEQDNFPSPIVDAGIVQDFGEGLVLIIPLQQVF